MACRLWLACIITVNIPHLTPSTKTPVIGAVQRKGNVVFRLLENITSDAPKTFVREMVSEKVQPTKTASNMD